MIHPTAISLPDRATIAGLVARVSDPGRERWLEQVERTGGCRRPIRLRGRVMRGGRLTYSTADEPDGVLMVRCRNRREACCPSCAHEYRGDMWQLVYAGLAGGRKGVPETVRSHPQAFVTLTAPSFGAVHTRRDDGRPCGCGVLHTADDPLLGAPLDPDDYDYEGAVLWNWHAPELWRRFVIDLARVLARQAGLTENELRDRLRISYVKVAEFQARGLVHLHAIILLDGPEGPGLSAPLPVSPDALCRAIEHAARRAHAAVPGANGEMVTARFGAQVHVRALGNGDAETVCPEAVAAYIAKYSSKCSHEAITTRRTAPDYLRDGGVPEHLVQMVTAALRLSGRPAFAALGRWATNLGFRGHFVTKSRQYSITLSQLRAERADYRAAQDAAGPCKGESTAVVATWEYLGSGYAGPGDALLAAAVEASLRERHDAALSERRGLACAPPER
ncbi:MAG: replication initiator [Thermoleophilia bacterium]